MTPSRMRSVTKMAVKAFEMSPSRTGPWATPPHKHPWVRLHPFTRCFSVSIRLCLCVSAHLYAPSHTCTHTQTHKHKPRTHHHSIVCPQSHIWPVEVMHSGDAPEVKDSPEDPLRGLLSCNEVIAFLQISVWPRT